MKSILIAGLVIAVPSGALAVQPADQRAREEAAAKAAEETAEARGDNAYVCKRFPPPPGTRLGKRQICKTQQEWDLIERDVQDSVREATRTPTDFK
ncbi:hypothetical protein [Sphingomicrobium aestuariivivum]|uniref:hypothetical protein n=1 Tax=Sphingomicrobium aestuariivivum TaxID=1582356 RepID=UPI001FD6FA76|nr:hypothetical protein [Sphingomicrobium aestuariivivum]MCJ8190924.1 hypothetical protein [Sphingomicrobium aestuariivivum]